MALMNEILVARNAFAETFTSSAVAKSVTMRGVPVVDRRGVHLVERGDRGLVARAHAVHESIGVQRVADREALAQELGVPGEAGTRPLDEVGEPRGGAHGNRALADDEVAGR